MSRSRRKTPIDKVCCCKSEKDDKVLHNRRFRRIMRHLIRIESFDKLKYKLREICEVWDFGGDGKMHWFGQESDECYDKMMRK